MEHIDLLVRKLVSADWKQRDSVKAELLAAAGAFGDPDAVIAHLEEAKREINSLEIRWEIDEVVEALTPVPAEPETEPEAEPEAEPEDPNRPLASSDLDLVYDDPRGLMLHKSKVGERWFVTQVDPYTRQPVTQEIPLDQLEAVKGQLTGSPYWVLGSGQS
jgi:hypothetical protein